MRSASFDMDTTDIVKMSYNFSQGPKIAQRELLKGMRRAVNDTRAITKQGMPYKSGLMQEMMPTTVVSIANNIQGEIRATARSSAGFPYPWVSNYGRGAIRPVNKKWLRFRASDGTIVFTKYVKPMAGKFWAEKGLERSRTAIAKRIDVAVDTITRFLTGTGR